MTLFLIVAGLLVLIGVFIWLKFRSACAEIEHLVATNQQLDKQNQTLKAQKAVAESQVKNYQVRTENEKVVSGVSRDGIVEQLHEHGDLRSDE
ncbi:DUF2681 domain-containing protein [[Haemophilus] felis]|uniref:DUF2681 domain-containing protein n=1 Tax=[Haemophilus] felis TaxID=123822 RepID=A0A1T0B6M5_9PAST|nr:DUF2681 domain-containing protein [[Haemophilus] felis]OOS05860.1 hypothetical protein B0188_03535 [[Haemophilus] felis]